MFDRGLIRILADDLQWSDVPSATFKLCLLVYKCLHRLTPRHLTKLYTPAADTEARRHLLSISRGLWYELRIFAADVMSLILDHSPGIELSLIHN